MTKECKQQFTLRISQANATELVVILYEMVLAYLDDGQEARKAEDKAALLEAIQKTRGCINELLNSLNLKYEPAPQMQQLYLYCIGKLAACEGGCQQGGMGDDACFDEIRQVIQPLHDAYQEIAKLNNDGAVMNNSQTVYAGLTYGKHALTENMADQGANRGVLA